RRGLRPRHPQRLRLRPGGGRRPQARMRRLHRAEQGGRAAGDLRVPAGKSGRTKVREGGQMTVVSTPRAPKAFGPYSQAISVGDFVFTSGQIPLDPETQALVTGDIRAQTERVMENLSAVLQAAEVGFAQV